MQKPLNPYVAGSALGGSEAFFGRGDILRLVESELRSPHQNAVVLFGQRRIGKTSILLQLARRLPESGFVPVYMDLMDRARSPLGRLLADLAGNVAAELGLEAPLAEAFDDAGRLDDGGRFDDRGRYFRQEFLPAVYRALDREGITRRLVFLFDEFDVLDGPVLEELPDTAAGWAFFPYLRQLMAEEKRLGFVIVVGRKTEQLSPEFRAAFRAARYQRVSVLKEEDAQALINLAEREGTLRFTSPAVARILALTAGHPYFTQLACFLLFNQAWRGEVEDLPQVGKADVDAIVPQVLESGNNAFEWIWDGLPPAERIIFSAIAEGSEEGQVLDEGQILEVLREHGIRILPRELELAPRTLVEWEMLCRDDGGYRFFIEMMRRWVARNRPMARVRDELDRVDVVADGFFRLGMTFYRQDNLEAAVEQLREAVTANPNHLQARLLLGACLREQGDLPEAVKELEWAYEYDPQAARYELVRTLLQQGERLEKGEAEDRALAVYERVLEVSPRERMAVERRAAIYERRGDRALRAGEYDAAIAAYGQAGAQEKVQEAQAGKRQAELEAYAQRGQEAVEAGDWARALEVYEWLATQDPDEPRWLEALNRARQERRLEVRYTAGLGAVEQKQWDLARRSLAEVISERPSYREASRYLHLAVAGQDAVALQARLEEEQAARQEVERRLEEAATFPFRYLSPMGWVAIAALALALLAIGGLLGALLGRGGGGVTGPRVSIEQPPDQSTVALSDTVEIIISAQAGQGVAYVNLQIGSREPITFTPPAGDPQTDYRVSHLVTFTLVGTETLTAWTYDRLGEASQPARSVVRVVQPTPVPTATPTPIPTATPMPIGMPGQCDTEPPPYYVVINRSVGSLAGRPGSACQPLILEHPECQDCTGPECNIDIEKEVCQHLSAVAGNLLYAICFDQRTGSEGAWMYRIFVLDDTGGCTVSGDEWYFGLPPGS